MRLAIVFAAAAALLPPAIAQAGVIETTTRVGGFSFTSLDDSADPTFNQLLGINNSGLIAGYFGSGAAGHPNQGFEIAAPYTSFVALNFPGSAQTQVTGLNNSGQVVGFGADTNNGVGADNNFGFIANPGAHAFLKLTNPVSGSVPPITQLLGVNDQSTAAGFFNDAAGISHGFTFDLGTMAVAPVAVPGATNVTATGINNGKKISGFFSDAGGNTLGFVENADGSGLKTFEEAGSTNTQFLGLNNRGQAVGFFNDAGGLSHGLLFDLATDTASIVDDPNAPGGTVINGLNDKDQLVGFFTDGGGNTHGLLVGVPEPATLALFGFSGLTLLALRRRQVARASGTERLIV